MRAPAGGKVSRAEGGNVSGGDIVRGKDFQGGNYAAHSDGENMRQLCKKNAEKAGRVIPS